MSYELPRDFAGEPQLIDGLKRLASVTVWMKNLPRRIAKALAYRRDLEALHRLPDHLLNDIGLDRGQIEYAVYNGRGE